MPYENRYLFPELEVKQGTVVDLGTFPHWYEK